MIPGFKPSTLGLALAANGFTSLGGGTVQDRTTLHDFIQELWPVIEPGRPFIDGLHIRAICDYLEAVTLGKVLRLIVNIPPRYGKSNIVTVLWPCWEWTLFPSRRWGFCSYSANLSTQHSLKRRRVLESDIYKRRWGSLVRLERDQNVKNEFENTRRGLMFSTSTGGTATGKGGDCLVGDDVLNPTTAESKAEREAAIDFLDHVWASRLDDKKNGRMVFVEQRLHTLDVTAHLTQQVGWTVLSLPSEFEDDRTITLPNSGEVITVKAGELLSPEREGRKELEAVKAAMGSRAYNAQYLQRPSSEEGALLRRSWFRCYTAGQIRGELFRVWSWDTAVKEGEANDYSVGTYWSATPEGFYLRDRIRARLNYPTLKREIKERYQAYPASAVLIEDAASGASVIQDLQGQGIPIIPVKADRDKVLRVNIQAPAIEAGLVWLPDAHDSPWVVDFRDECCEFPFSEHDDQIDSMTQALAYMRARVGNHKPVSASSDTGQPWATGRRPDWT